MLSTGVDIPDLEFIVLLRPVRSRILFEQILGRGTRRGERHPDKSHFTVFDCFGGTLFEYFKNATDSTTEMPAAPSRTLAEIIEAIWKNEERPYNTSCLVKRLHRIDKEMSGEGREDVRGLRAHGDLAAFARALPDKLARDFTATMKLLRDPAFQKLCAEYRRPGRSFTVAYGVIDTVSSELLVRDAAGNTYKPDDYLEAFAAYVRDNRDRIDAIRVLLDRPRSWSPAAWSELRNALRGTEMRFSVDALRIAHAARYKKDLVDLISMVKHAARDEEPLLTAAERVDRALARLTAGVTLTARAAGLARSDPLSPARQPVDRQRRLRRDAHLQPGGRLGSGERRLRRARSQAGSSGSTRRSRHERHRGQAVGVLSHPAARRDRLRRLHRADHLSAIPQDGRRAPPGAARGVRLAGAAGEVGDGADGRLRGRPPQARQGPGLVGAIFAEAQSRFNNPVNLKRLINLVDETEWTRLNVDVKAEAYEGLLEKAASEGKKGAGQYFTPRVLIQSIVRCMRPDPRVRTGFTISDPACGTGGFLVAAYEWLMADCKGSLDRDVAQRVKKSTYFGHELVARPRRLALMNLVLHGLEPEIELGNAIADPPGAQRFDVILTNPPFGTKGANQAPEGEDFVISTSNKQLNFVQHVLTLLKAGGRAAMVLPDNCLFADQAGEVFEILTQDCDLHTVLRLPRGTFTPYSQGVKANVVFFTKGYATQEVWIYDARTNVPGITKKDRPLTAAHFAGFEQCYGKNPDGKSKRKPADFEGGMVAVVCHRGGEGAGVQARRLQVAEGGVGRGRG